MSAGGRWTSFRLGIWEKVASRRYTSISEVVREALRLMERSERLEGEQLEALRRAWREGIDSGDAGVLDFAELREDALREAASRLQDWMWRRSAMPPARGAI